MRAGVALFLAFIAIFAVFACAETAGNDAASIDAAHEQSLFEIIAPVLPRLDMGERAALLHCVDAWRRALRDVYEHDDECGYAEKALEQLTMHAGIDTENLGTQVFLYMMRFHEKTCPDGMEFLRGARMLDGISSRILEYEKEGV